MALKLVASGDDRALAIRDRLLPLVREHGALEVQRGPVRLVVLRTDPWSIGHWTRPCCTDPKRDGWISQKIQGLIGLSNCGSFAISPIIPGIGRI